MRTLLVIFLLFIVVTLTIVQLSTRNSIHKESINNNLSVTTITVNNAKIYLVERDNKLIMIDSGNPGDEHEIEAFMRDAGLEPDAIDYLILTHGHLDHLGTAAYFQNKYGISVLGGRGDAKMFAEGRQQPLCSTSMLAKAIDMSLQGKTYKHLTPDILIDKPYSLASLGVEGSILPMPGHTLGTLLVSFDNIIFVGDLIRGELVRHTVPNRHFFMCDLQDNDDDIRSVLVMEQYTTWYTGHFGPLLAADVAMYWN